jgi:hypothetical protein
MAFRSLQATTINIHALSIDTRIIERGYVITGATTHIKHLLNPIALQVLSYAFSLWRFFV